MRMATLSAYSLSWTSNFLRLSLLLALLSCIATQFCSETLIANQQCHYLAECSTADGCTCPRGTIDKIDIEGRSCGLESFVARLVVKYPADTFDPDTVLPVWGTLLAQASTAANPSAPALFQDADYLAKHAVYQTTTIDGEDIVTLSGLFRQTMSDHAGQVSAELLELYPDDAPLTLASMLGATERVWGPKKYAFYLPSTDAYLPVGPSGLEVDNVFFESKCLDSGCWVVDIKYSVGSPDSMNVLYLPIADDGALTYPETKDPLNFPCGSNQWDAETLIEQTACCMEFFEERYRVSNNFALWLANEYHDCPACPDDDLSCPADPAWELDVTDADWTNAPIYGGAADPQLPQLPGNFVAGPIKGMARSHVAYTGVLDYTLGIHQARLYLDEVEVRSLAAERAGTLEVEYTLDMFVGIAEFTPTSTKFMDAAMKQVGVHLEKSAFFAVAQHGVVGPGPPVWCCGPGCVPAYDTNNQPLGYEVCPPDRLGLAEAQGGCVNVEGPFDAGMDPCAKCPASDPDCVITQLECQNFYYKGVYYVFPDDSTDPPTPGNVTIGEEFGACCVEVDTGVYYPPDCNAPGGSEGCERIYVRGAADNVRYPDFLLGMPEAEWPAEYDGTYIACCESAWSEYFLSKVEDCSLYEGFTGAKKQQLLADCRARLEETVIDRCFACPEGMSECDCNRHSCGDADPVSNFQLRLNEVLDPDNPDPDDALQYLQLSFSTGSGFQPSAATGAVALNSIVVAKDTFYEGAAFSQACGGTSDPIYQRAGMAAAYAERWGSDCAPDNEVCSKVAALPDNFAALNIPLGRNFFFRNETTPNGLTSVFVEFVVTLERTTGSPGTFATLVKLAIPLIPGGVNTWCQSRSAATDLQQVANADLLVGSALTAPELDRLMLFSDIAGSTLDPAAATEFATASIESGLMTLVVKGDETYFNLPGTRLFSLELEDVMSVHVMESGDATWTRVAALLAQSDNGAAAFEVQTDRWGHRAFLEPSPSLLEICSFNARPSSLAAVIPSSCILRRDIQGRVPVNRRGAEKTAVELTASSEADAAAFLGSVLGRSEYAATLAREFRGLVRSRWGVNDRYIRAWWINPGYEWTPTQTGGQQVFSVSQKLVVFALINLNEGFGSTRREAADDDGDAAVRAGKRMLLASASEDPRNGVGARSMRFPISAEDIVCQALACDMDAMTAWEVAFGLREEEACYGRAALMDLLRGKLKGALKESPSTSRYESVQVLNVAVDRGGVRCDGEGRRALLQAGASAVADALILFRSEEAAINVDEVRGAGEGILAMKASAAVPAKISVVDTGSPAVPGSAGADGAGGNEEEDDDDGHRKVTIIMAALFGSVGLALMVVAAVLAWRVQLPQGERVSVVEPLTPAEFEQKMGTAALKPAQAES